MAFQTAGDLVTDRTEYLAARNAAVLAGHRADLVWAWLYWHGVGDPHAVERAVALLECASARLWLEAARLSLAGEVPCPPTT